MADVLTGSEVHENQFQMELQQLCRKHRITPLMTIYYVQGNPHHRMGFMKVGECSRNWADACVVALKQFIGQLAQRGLLK